MSVCLSNEGQGTHALCHSGCRSHEKNVTVVTHRVVNQSSACQNDFNELTQTVGIESVGSMSNRAQRHKLMEGYFEALIF